MRISAIAAMAQNRVIGKNNDLPWKIPADLKRFKTVTWGHPVLMGRKTFDSIKKPLPGRKNWVLTRSKNLVVPGAEVVHSVQEAVEGAKKDGASELFIVGGSEIYEMALPMTQRFYLTVIHRDYDGDAYFPELDLKEFIEIENETFVGDPSYTFLTVDRK